MLFLFLKKNLGLGIYDFVYLSQYNIILETILQRALDQRVLNRIFLYPISHLKFLRMPLILSCTLFVYPLRVRIVRLMITTVTANRELTWASVIYRSDDQCDQTQNSLCWCQVTCRCGEFTVESKILFTVYIYMLEVDLWRSVFIFVRDGLGVSCCYNKAAGKQGEHLCTSLIPYNKSLLNQEISIS